ncbi:peptidoglycan DD-metalloendopeptidase family protein [Deinococcus detaillensis]|uniref:Peptidoglycan DD-metalloendopeptidase family protein n=1 Tax=Deinococcus detaillensis TaxID=2592048 RepID=A0A553ULM2_9DEIO|nr:peptidoglycan DD-metalloendopeptidase family protein [Deinococcus detaillensis]TSA81092.1 peptidoglycan DD-metalloendopeptidase family protein [Deinococcus detaillensis]
MKATLLTVPLALLLLGAAGAYTVKKGDTLYSLARNNNLKVEDLRRLNNLTSDNLALGQQLRLSTAERLPTAPPSPATLPKPAATPPSGFTLTPPAEPAKPAEKPVAPPTAPPPTLIVTKTLPPTPSSPPVTIRSGSTFKVGDVEVKLPSQLSMGDAFIIKLTGGGAEQVKVSFPSELSEDVRQPNEVLTPSGAAGVYVVPGRVVLGKTTPVIVEIKLGSEVVRGIIPLTSKARGPVVKLQLSPQVAKKLTDPGKAAEDAMVNKAYLNRGLPLWVRPFAAPLPNPVIPGSFGQSRTYTPGSPVTYHYGADFPAKLGSSIKAINDGTVVIAGMYPVRGGLVMIDHGGGISSLYFHQSKILVKVGQSVKRGDVIGKVGTTGISEGPHLHLEVRVRGEATNPADWIDRLWP